MATITAVGSRITQQNAATTTSTMSINPTAIGNIFVFFAICPSNTINASTLTGGNCTWTAVPGATTSGTGREFVKVWWGKATATGASNTTTTWSASATGLFPATTAQQFTCTGVGSATPWALVASGHLENTASAAVTYSTLTATGSTQLYLGLGSTSVAGIGTSDGSTTGSWVWQTDGYGSAITYKLSAGPGAVTANAAVNSSPSETSNSSAVLLTADLPTGGRFFPFLDIAA